MNSQDHTQARQVPSDNYCGHRSSYSGPVPTHSTSRGIVASISLLLTITVNVNCNSSERNGQSVATEGGISTDGKGNKSGQDFEMADGYSDKPNAEQIDAANKRFSEVWTQCGDSWIAVTYIEDVFSQEPDRNKPSYFEMRSPIRRIVKGKRFTDEKSKLNGREEHWFVRFKPKAIRLRPASGEWEQWRGCSDDCYWWAEFEKTNGVMAMSDPVTRGLKFTRIKSCDEVPKK